MKKLRIVALLLIFVMLLAACDNDSPKRRDDKPGTEGATPTEPETTKAPDTTETPTPEVTETPTEAPTPTAEATPTPAEATPTPTEAATPTPTLSPTPAMPKVAATTGPAYVIGQAEWYRYEMDENDPKQGAHQAFIYIVEPDNAALEQAVYSEAYIAAGEYIAFIDSTAKAANEDGIDIKDWFYIGSAKIGRADSLVFSYSRGTYSYKGGAHPNYSRRGWNYSVKTGEHIALKQMVTDYDALRDLVIKSIEENPDYKDSFLFDNWKDRIAGLFRGETIQWVAVDDGLEIWLNEGSITAMSVGEVTVHVRIVDHPELFAPEWVGGYDGSIKRKVPDYASYHSTMYNAVIPAFAKGIKSMTWTQAVLLLKEKGIYFEGMDAEEAAKYEENAFLQFSDPATGYAYYLMFWPLTSGVEDQLESVRYKNYGAHMYFDCAYGSLPTRYQLVDPWIEDDYDRVIAVSFDNVDDFGLVADVTIARYYGKW